MKHQKVGCWGQLEHRETRTTDYYRCRKCGLSWSKRKRLPVTITSVDTPTPAMGCILEWKETRGAVYPQCRYAALHGSFQFRLAHFTPQDIWRLTTRTIASNDSPYSGWLSDEWFDTKEAAQAAAERRARGQSA